ncbi:hypothetical protein ACEZDB_15705 [Streptacidiphilus sp. N1-3]|uniref:Uncharacterized protein n=1 Tax=Streptacidiphilus alkalitolerans TaxID=3342712 RepID=A0ABV6X1M0_9ACTN
MSKRREPPGGDHFDNRDNTHHGPTHTGSGDQTNFFLAVPRWWIYGLSSVVAAAAITVAILFRSGPGTGVPVAKGSTSPKGSTSSQHAAEDLETQASWCCKFATVLASTGFYWPGTSATLTTALAPTGTALDPATLMPAGLGLIEILLQTSGTEPIMVEPPKAIVRTRSPNLRDGVVAILPRGGQGGGAAAQFEADVDDTAPVTRPVGSANAQGANYQYVSANSPEVMTLFVADTHYDCSFDVQLTWLEQGVTHTALLTNGGRHFRMVGSEGLLWYAGDPRLGAPLARVAGKPFSYYAQAK